MTIESVEETILYSNKLLAEVVEKYGRLEATGALTRGDCIELSTRKFKELRDAGDISHDVFLDAVEVLVESGMGEEPVRVVSPRIVAPVTPETPRIPFKEMMGHLDNFIIWEIKHIWGKWAKSVPDPTPYAVFGAEYLVDLYKGTMLTEMLPRVIKPQKSETGRMRVYTDVIIEYFKGEATKYSDLKRKHPKDDRVWYGFEGINSRDLLKTSLEIERAGGAKHVDHKLVIKEDVMKEINSKLSNVRLGIRRYYIRNAIFISYLELIGVNITNIRPSDFQIFQAYISRNYEIFSGGPYTDTMWNDYRTRCSRFWNYLAKETTIPVASGEIKDVPVLAAKTKQMAYPVDAYALKFNDNWTLDAKKDEVLKVYNCISTTTHPKIKKHRELLMLILRLFRETGLRYEHITYLRWGRLPKRGDKPFTKVKGRNVFKIDYMGFDEEAGEFRKDVPREYGLISTLLANKIFKYRDDHPDETHDDYYVMSGKTLFGWSDKEGGYRTSTAESIDPKTGRPRKTNAFNAALAWMREACGDKVRIAPSRFRDGFMTLMLEVLVSTPVQFKDISGDLVTTAMKHYRAPAQYIKVPERGKLTYPQIVALTFDKETLR
jgi:hypothetical protein